MKSDALQQLAPTPPAFGPNIAPVKTIADVWGTAPASDCSSREFPVSSFSTVRVDRTQDYWEYQRILDSIEARLQRIKREVGLA